MARIQILTELEEKKFNEPPLFSLQDRKYYFHINENLLNKLYEKIQTKNICYVILQIGYLKARNSFFNNEYNEDIHYIEEKFSLKFNPQLPERTKRYYHNIIRELVSINIPTKEDLVILSQLALQLANLFQDRKKIFWALVNKSRELKLEIPSYRTLTEIIAESINIQKSAIIEKLIHFGSNESLKKLDIFLDKDEKFKNKYQIGSFRRLEHSTAQKKIRKSLSHFQTIKTIFVLNKNIINSIGITSKIAQYYAMCWDAKNLATECIHTWPADAL